MSTQDNSEAENEDSRSDEQSSENDGLSAFEAYIRGMVGIVVLTTKIKLKGCMRDVYTMRPLKSIISNACTFDSMIKL